MPIKDWLFFPHILLQLNPNNSQGEPREDKQGSIPSSFYGVLYSNYKRLMKY